MKNTVLLPSWAPHGKALQAYWEGNSEASLGITIKGDSTDWMPVSTYFRAMDEMPELETFALSLCTGKILDVGAGAGAHSLLLQESGKDVTGLDIIPEAVEIMKARGIKKVVCSDFIRFQPKAAFDTLLFLMNGIGVAGDLIGLQKFLIHAHQLTSINGQILLDSSDLRKTRTNLETTNQYFGSIDYQLSFEDYLGETYQWLYVDPTTLAQIADKTSWYSQVIFENDDGSFLARLIKK